MSLFVLDMEENVKMEFGCFGRSGDVMLISEVKTQLAAGAEL